MIKNVIRYCAASASLLGWVSLALSHEIRWIYLGSLLIAWLFSWFLPSGMMFRKAVKRIENALIFIVIGLFVRDFVFVGYNVFQSMAHFLMGLQIIKLLTPQETKDHQQILVYGFLHALSACTLSVEFYQAFVFLSFIPLGCASLLASMFYRFEKKNLSEQSRVDSEPSLRRFFRLFVLSVFPFEILFVVAVFLVFPRLNFNFGVARWAGVRSGYSEEVRLTDGGTLSQSEQVVMWLSFIPSKDRTSWSGYLRGSTLDAFDGTRWSKSPVVHPTAIYPTTEGHFQVGTPHYQMKRLRYAVTVLNPVNTTVFVIPSTMWIRAPLAALQIQRDQSMSWVRSWRKPFQYEAESQELAFMQAPVEKRHTQLPAIIDTKLGDLAKKVMGRGSVLDQASRLENYFKTEFTYSKELMSVPSADWLGAFLRKTRKGPCGYFASAMAILLRSQGIPSRLVAGYKQGEWNEKAQAYLIREKDAHAWVEVYDPARGWIRFDPTPTPTDIVIPSLLVHWTRQEWDYWQMMWTQKVMEYDLYSQTRFLQKVAHTSQDWTVGGAQLRFRFFYRFKQLGAFGRDPLPNHGPMASLPVGWIFLGVVLLVFGGWMWKRRWTQDAVTRYEAFLTQMARKGFPKSPSETPLEYQQRLLQNLTNADQLKQTTLTYLTHRFIIRPK